MTCGELLIVFESVSVFVPVETDALVPESEDAGVAEPLATDADAELE